MKYTMVKQFSNASIDNIFSFFFKIGDFFKVLYEAFWVFLEIWIAFFLIFYNIAMYIYYFILFIIDRGSEESGPFFRFRKSTASPLSAPSIIIPTGVNPIPSMYGRSKNAVAATGTALVSAASSIKQAIPPLKASPSGTGAKRNILKSILEGIASFFSFLITIILKPFKAIIKLFDRIREHREKEKAEEKQKQKPKSLIAEYLKEYEQRKR